MLQNIPVNIITGFLGVGKTTAIQQLLKNKPADEKWAVLVNEFGQIGIDQTAFDADQGVVIKELPGGCICCTLGLPLTMSLVMLLQRSKPDRVIIEPTGIGHPTGILDTLRSEPFAEALDIKATVCLVDPRSLEDPRVLSNEIFQDQINIADVLVINKIDLASAELVGEMKQRGSAMFPPKAAVIESIQGDFGLDVLDLIAAHNVPTYPKSHTHQEPAHEHEHEGEGEGEGEGEQQSLKQPEPHQPRLEMGEGFGHFSYGWLFHPDDIFDLDKLSLWCYQQSQIERIKGAVRIGQQWILLNQILGEQVTSPLAWRRDSRIELISAQALDTEQLRRQLLDCLQS